MKEATIAVEFRWSASPSFIFRSDSSNDVTWFSLLSCALWQFGQLLLNVGG